MIISCQRLPKSTAVLTLTLPWNEVKNFMRRGASFFFLKNLFWAFVVGGLTGFVVSSTSPTKKGRTLDVVLGMVGAFLGGVFLNVLRAGTPRFFGLLLFQVIGALVLIGFGRLLTGKGI